MSLPLLQPATAFGATATPLEPLGFDSIYDVFMNNNILCMGTSSLSLASGLFNHQDLPPLVDFEAQARRDVRSLSVSLVYQARSLCIYSNTFI